MSGVQAKLEEAATILRYLSDVEVDGQRRELLGWAASEVTEIGKLVEARLKSQTADSR